MSNNLSYPTIIPELFGWKSKGKLMFSISISINERMSAELNYMTLEEVQEFIDKLQDGVDIFKDYYDSSPTTKTEVDEK